MWQSTLLRCPPPRDQHGLGAGPVLRPGCQQSPWLDTTTETLLPAFGELTAGGTVSPEEKAVGRASDVLGLCTGGDRPPL